MEQFKKQKGVTMIALVVTIVVMLIIASIMVATFSGKSGMVDKATDSQIMTELSQLQDTLNSKRAEGEGKRLKSGDYSGELSNDDLAKQDEPIIREFETSIPNENEEYLDNAQKRVIGVVSLKNLGISSSLGNNEENYKQENSTQTNTGVTIGTGVKLDDFTDVFFITVDDNDLYYIQDGKLWSINGEVAKYELNKKEETKVEGPILSATPETGSELESPKTITLKAEKKTNEIPLSNEYQYYLSTNDRILSGGSYNKFTFGDAYEKQIEISGSTGISYYLFVKQFTDGAGEKSSGGELITVSGITYHRFGPYTFGKKEVDNSITFNYKINGQDIDNSIAEKINNKKWINQEITVEVKWGSSLTNKQLITSEQNSDNYEIKENNSIIVKAQSQNITAQATGTEGDVSKTTTVKVDSKKPIIEIGKNTGDNILISEKGTIKTKITLKDEGGSGLNLTNENTKYGWSTSDEQEPSKWEELINEETQVTYDVSDNAKHYLWVKAKDNAENENTQIEKYELSNDPIAKVVIGEEETFYASVQDAIDYCSKEGIESKVYLLRDVEEAASTYVGQNIILDLCGHTITNTEDKPTIENNATLKIIDSSETEDLVGKIICDKNVAIKNNENATFTLGSDDGNVSQIRPVITGNINGIENNGTFNFYDGIITGKAKQGETILAIKGKVNTTPSMYAVLANTNDSGDQVAVLKVQSDAVAKIEETNTYYTTFPAAFEDIEEGKIIKDTQYTADSYAKDNLLLLKDEKLDLDGTNYTTITAPTNDSYGTVEVTVQINTDFKPVSSWNWYECSTIFGCELPGTQKDWGIIIDRNGYFAIGYNTSTIYSSKVYALDGEIHTVTYTYTSGKLKFAVDGNIIGTISYTPGGNLCTEYGIGWNKDSSRTAIQGTIYSVRYYNGELSDENIKLNQNVDNKRFNNVVSEDTPLRTIKVLKPITIEDKIITGAKNIKLDLAGNQVSLNGIENEGRLEITDSSEEQTGTIVNTSTTLSSTIINKGCGVLTLTGGVVKNTNSNKNVISNYGSINFLGGELIASGSGANALANYSTEKQVINGTKITLNSTGEKGIYNINNGHIKFENGNISSTKSESWGIYNNSNGTIEINGGKIETSYPPIGNNGNNGTILVTGGELISTSDAGICNYQNAKISVTGGSINSSSIGIYTKNPQYYNGVIPQVDILVSGDANIKSTRSHAIYTYATGTIKIEGGKIESTDNTGIYNEKDMSVEVSGGEIIGVYYGIYNREKGTIKITDGTIKTTGLYGQRILWGDI